MIWNMILALLGYYTITVICNLLYMLGRNRLSWLAAVNIILFQWFFIRLTKHWQNWEDKAVDIKPDPEGGSNTVTLTGVAKYQLQFWSFMYWVVPLTGWFTDFKFLGKQKFKILTKDKVIEIQR